MNFSIIEEKDNPLFKRKEILASVDYQGGSTPSKAALQKAIAEQFKVGADSVEIDKILSEIGMTKGKAWIKIWQEKKVPIYTEKKSEAKTEEAPKEAPAEEKKEESPKESPAEETPKEETKE